MRLPTFLDSRVARLKIVNSRRVPRYFPVIRVAAYLGLFFSGLTMLILSVEAATNNGNGSSWGTAIWPLLGMCVTVVSSFITLYSIDTFS